MRSAWQQLSSVRCNRVVRFAPATILDLADCEKLLSQLPDSIQSDNTQRRESVALPPVAHHDIQLHRTLAFDKFDLASRPHTPKTRHQVPLVGFRTNCTPHGVLRELLDEILLHNSSWSLNRCFDFLPSQYIVWIHLIVIDLIVKFPLLWLC